MKFYLTYENEADKVFEKLSANGDVMDFSSHYCDGVRVIHDKNASLY